MSFHRNTFRSCRFTSKLKFALDVALGIGGLPRGRVIEVYGPESSGKTTVALHAVANAQKAAENAEPLIDGMSMLTVLGILLAVLCAVLVVRHFLRQKFRHTDTACTDTTVRHSTHKRARRWPRLFLSPVDKVRREYAIYLDHCQRHGVTILRGDTSLDLTGRAFGMDFAAEAELRQIYLKARYNGIATAEDAARAAELVRKICS